MCEDTWIDIMKTLSERKIVANTNVISLNGKDVLFCECGTILSNHFVYCPMCGGKIVK